MSDGIRAMLMRGGTSKGLYFLKDDLPSDVAARDDLLLRIMGSPDVRQIDGLGGGNPLTSKVAIVSQSNQQGADVDYLFLQVFVDQALVSDAQNCGNILSGVGPFAIERGLIAPCAETTQVRINMINTGQMASAVVQTKGGQVCYDGAAMIDGAPFSSAPIELQFLDSAGSMCGSLLPTGNAVDLVDGLRVSMIDNGMPCVILNAQDMAIKGDERPADLDANLDLKARLEKIRLICGPLMNLGDVSKKSVPKMVLVSPPQSGGVVQTRCFIPHKCHETIGVMAAVSVATAVMHPKGPAHDVGTVPDTDPLVMSVEHPAGETSVILRLKDGAITSSAILRTARKLMDGVVFPRPHDASGG